jgi:hypothetical protein
MPGRSSGASVAYIHSNRAAAALRLTPLQASAFIAAQLAVPALKGVAPLRSLQDVVRFVSIHNPGSRFRVAQRVAHEVGNISTKPHAVGVAERETEDPRWSELVHQWQKLLDEHLRVQLAQIHNSKVRETII